MNTIPLTNLKRISLVRKLKMKNNTSNGKGRYLMLSNFRARTKVREKSQGVFHN